MDELNTRTSVSKQAALTPLAPKDALQSSHTSARAATLISSASLKDFVADLVPTAPLRVEEELGSGFVKLRVQEAEARQAEQDIRSVEDALIELLRNSLDAHASHIFVATAKEGSRREITILDDGDGIPKEFHTKIFEPRVTSKLNSFHEDFWGVHGRGMALYSIAHHALRACVVASAPHVGASLTFAFDTAACPEKRDQSSFPTIRAARVASAAPQLTGIHNMLRACVEFCLHAHTDCALYLGSPAEIVATLIQCYQPRLSGSSLLSSRGRDMLALVKQPSLASSAQELTDAAKALGLELSTRTSARILAGEISPLASIDQRIQTSLEKKPARTPDIFDTTRKLQVSESDRADLELALTRAFAPFAKKYYIAQTGKLKIRINPSNIQVVFPFEDDADDL